MKEPGLQVNEKKHISQSDESSYGWWSREWYIIYPYIYPNKKGW